MAIGEGDKPCTVVLHDDAVSLEDVLCGANILTPGDTAYLVAPGSKALCVHAKGVASNPDEVSVHVSVAKLFGFENRMKASIQVVEDIETATATHVEVFFRDQYLSRADMWRIKSQVDSSVLHENQRMPYLGSVSATVEALYISGRHVRSAFVSHPQTKLIFRSISARFTILIQISKEMLEDWTGGDLMYEAMISGFLPELFQRWDQLKVRHQVSIILFGRLLPERGHNKSGTDGERIQADDFFHLVELDMPSSNWRELLRNLKREFNSSKVPRQVSLAARGNMLEALHLAAMDFADRNTDPRLSSTNTSILAISAGSGMFEAQYEVLKSTTDLLMGTNIGVDLVHLAPKPLHAVPLFHYRRDEVLEYALPHWLDVSYWTPDNEGHNSQWLFGESSNDVQNTKIARLEEDFGDTAGGLIAHRMDRFDEQVFSIPSAGAFESVSMAFKPSSSHVSPVGKEDLDTKNMALAASNAVSTNDLPAKAGVDTHRSRTTSLTATQVTKGENKDRAPRHPFLQIDRKISLGPRGLAPGAGVASTTVSAQHAQQDRDVTTPASFTANETTSGLARQIKESLRKKPSQQSLASRALPESAEPSKPVSIPAAEVRPAENPRDPASLVEEAIMKPIGRSAEDSTVSLSSTPKGQPGALSLSESGAPKDQDDSTNPWLTLMNPCNPRKANMQVAVEYRQWQNVFPKALGSDVFKWKSMCSPAALPLISEGRFSIRHLEMYFDKKVRRLLASAVSTSSTKSARQAMWRMIAIRLSAGFQIVPLRRLPYGQIASEHLERILLSLGSQYHELRYISESELQITEYERQSESKRSITYDSMPSPVYETRLRSAISNKEQSVHIDLSRRANVYDWSRLDDECVNGNTYTDTEGLCRMRFVLIPTDSSRTDSRGTAAIRELSDDERRLDGIHKLTQMWQRHRYFSDEDQRHQAFMIKTKASGAKERDPNPLAVEYQTRDTSAVVGAYGMNLSGQAEGDRTARLFAESEQYHSSNFDIAKLVKQMQEPPPNGVEFRDRRWLTRLHLKCFRGDEMTNWLLRVFKDLQTRDDALALGNQLMDREIFSHVRGRHEFRDGNFFYQIKAAHRTTDYPDTAGFFSKPLGRSVPSTPIPEQKHSPSGQSVQGDADTSEKNTRTPTLAPTDRKKTTEVLLSQKLQYNVDPGGKSNQLEMVNLHYDRIHNPENCYHILIDWTITTPKLIRDSVSRWSALVEGYGLKLVQVPIREACRIHEQHPFDQTISVNLAVRPPQGALATPQLDPQSFSPRLFEDANGYHKAVLRKAGFVLDLESAQSFPRNVDVSYSWGRPDYEHTQFVHKTGLLLVQIVNDSKIDFLILPNRLAQPVTSGTSKRTESVSVESIAQTFLSFCRDGEGLNALFEDFNKPKAVAPSPFANALPADNDVPPIELPPHLTHHRALLKHTG